MAKLCDCGRICQKDKDVCVWCDETISDEQKAAWRSKGGKASRKVEPWQGVDELQEIEIEKISDLKRLYVTTLQFLVQGTLTPAQARAVVAIGAGLKDCLELEMIDKLLERKGELLQERQGGGWALVES